MAISDLRKDYSLAGLHEKDLARDPFRQFDKWFQEAQAAKLPEPNAMTLSTSTPDGRPSSRIVLLKGVDGRGFVFFGNYESRKGRELAANPRASLLFPWFPFERQVIVEGVVARISQEENAAYFHSRPRASQIGTWASPQSTVIPDRRTLEASFKAMETKYAEDEVPLPPHWGGWRLTPQTVEFWQGRRSRLHDRLRYRRIEGGEWIVERLAP
ncbi:pyridoxamine 5'-phosphate oxidase [Geminisphaera colitermitum]|uniref:pyridoxamine 5'-phosphate oxidase n=1 Tax=Geminisphaera colitermitum TaxID=1148786 RepID=UPI0005BB78ED|nr:pyridoxamine 5'-phosphate oxidase [Geminisphaera colitermitum]